MTQEKALKIMLAGHNVFLTGAAGSGKTYLLNRFISQLHRDEIKVGITASTGIAATHIDGRTIHSWAGMGIKDDISERELKRLSKTEEIRERIRGTKVLIIDEISMLDAKRLDLVDRICRFFNDPFLPFGGIQIVLCGDFFQLPPIGNGAGQPLFAFQSQAWQEAEIKVCYLSKQFRQGDARLVSMLNRIRRNETGEKEIKCLSERIGQDVGGLSTRLYTHNIDVDAINARELSRLAGESREYRLERQGIEDLCDLLVKTYLVPERLAVKVGAKVMFVKNNFSAHYANGTLGKVIGFSANGWPLIETYSGNLVEASPSSWNLEDDSGQEVVASLRQLPLKLAWAITVHKSQGMTLDAASMDLSRAFAPGMGYVALSRVKSLSGIRLEGFNPLSLRVSEEIAAKDQEFVNESKKTEKIVGK